MAISSTPLARSASDQLLHVDRVEVLDHAVMEAFRLGHFRVGHFSPERADVQGEALSEVWVLRQPVEALSVHATAPQAVDQKPLELEVEAEPAGRKVAGTVGACGDRGTGDHTASHGQFFRRRHTKALA